MKKILLITISLSLFFVFSFVLSQYMYQNSYNDKTEQFLHETPTATIHNILSKKQGLYYFGFSTCPWCVELLPILNSELAKAKTTSWVVNIHDNTYSHEDHIQLQNFYQYMTEKDVKFPLIIAINSTGQYKIHVGTVKSHNAKEQKISAAQQKELESILQDMIHFSNN